MRRVPAFLVVALCATFGVSGASAVTHVVNSTGDQADAVLNNGQCLTSVGTCTLRAALQEISNTVGPHTVSFAIPTTGVATINVGTLLPTVNRQTLIDGFSQTSTVGDTNPVQLGAGLPVGVDQVPLPPIAGPEIEIRDNSAGGLASGLNVTASNVEIRGIAIHGFGNGVGNGDIVLGGATATGASIHDNVIGSGPTAIALPPTATHQTAGAGIFVNGQDQGTIQRNVIAHTAQTGIRFAAGALRWTVAANEVLDTSRTNGVANGISFEGAGTTGNLVSGNRILRVGGAGIDVLIGPQRLTNNTIAGNGVFGPVIASTETAGIRVQGTGTTIDRNLVDGNYGAGVMVVAAANQANWITRNAILRNGTVPNRVGAPATTQIGIDLLATGAAGAAITQGTAPFVTQNDLNDADTGGNVLTNFPVLLTATRNATTLTVTGFARPGAVVELFVADPDGRGFGEGGTYLTSFSEGSAADTDPTAGSYTNPVNGLNQGSDATERFTVTIPLASLPTAVSGGTRLTATATVGNATSEFSGLVTVTAPPLAADLSVALVDAPDPVFPGQTVTWTATVTNAGPDPASATTLNMPVPAGVSALSATASQGTCDIAVSCALGTLAPGERAAVTVTATAGSPGTVSATAAVTSATPDPAPGNDVATAITTVSVATPSGPGVPALGLSLDASRVALTPGRELATFTASLTNTGGAPTSAGEVTVDLQGGSVRSHVADGACIVTRIGAIRRVRCAVPAIPVGGTAVVAVVAQSSAASVLRATASAAAGPLTAGPVASAARAQLGRLVVTLSHPPRARVNQLVPVAITVHNRTGRTARGAVLVLAPPVAPPVGPVDLRTIFARARVPSSQTVSYALGDIPAGSRRALSVNLFTGRTAVPRRLSAAVVALDGVAGAQRGSTITVRRALAAPAVTG